MAGRTFLDTNIFVYAEDDDEPAKQAIARDLIRQLAKAEEAVISTQVLTEYVAAGRHKLGLSVTQCREGVLLMSQFDVALIRPEHVLGALDLAATYSLSHWDALVVKTASAAGCHTLVTEDLQDGQSIDGLTIRNPFA